MKKTILLFTAMICFLTIEAQTITKFEGKRHLRPDAEYVNLDSGEIRYTTASYTTLQLDFRFEFTNGNIDLEVTDTIIIHGHIGNQDFEEMDTIILKTPLAAGATLSSVFPDEKMAYFTNVFTPLNDSIVEGTIYGKIEYISRYTTIPPERSTKIHLIKEQSTTPPGPSDSTAVVESVMAKVKLYPNPVSDNLHITNLKNTNVEVYNVVGQRVYHFENVSEDLSINMKTFPDGIYFVKLQNGKAVRTEKIKLVK